MGTLARVLVCDGDEVVREQFRRALAVDGHEVFEALSGPACLRLLAEAEPDVILLSESMQAADGRSVLEKLEHHRERNRFGVVLVTGSIAGTDVHKGWELGADAYIRTSTEPVEIARVVADVAWRKRRREPVRMEITQIARVQPRPLG